jgi:glycosyltransferase involved in cell wall biosynthesis
VKTASAQHVSSNGDAQGKAQVSTFRRGDSQHIVFVPHKEQDFGGLEKHLLDLLERMREPGLQLSIICFGKDVYTERIDPNRTPNITVRPWPEPTTLSDWIRLFRQIPADIAVFYYGWIGTFSWQAPAGAMLAGVGKSFAVQHLVPPPLPPREGSSPRARLRHLIGQRARRFFGWRVAGHLYRKTVCVSNAVRDPLIRDYRFPRRKTLTIHNGVSTSAFVPCDSARASMRARFSAGPDDFLLICVARLGKAKGIDILIQAVFEVIRRGISLKCLLLGDGPLREDLLQQAHSLGLSRHLFFEGFQKDVRPYLQAGSAFILTSHLEGLPLSVLEAMSCGLPCIVTDVGGSAEAVKHQAVGLVIPPGSVDAAADAISYLATHPSELAEMSRKTRDRVCREFDIENSMSELKRVILS